MNAHGDKTLQYERDELNRWARNVLEAPAVEGNELLAFLCRRLADDEFALSDETRSAVLTLTAANETVPSRTSRQEFDADFERRLNDEIDEFAQQFFSLPCDERRNRWMELWRRKGLTPAQDLRLELLESGLNIDADLPAPVEGIPEQPSELATVLLGLFVLTPPKRAERWRLERLRIHEDATEWSRAAVVLKKESPKIASLLPGIVEELVRLHPARQMQAKRQRQLTYAAQQKVRTREYSDQLEPVEVSNGWRLVVIVLCVVACFIVIGELMERDAKLDETSRMPRTPNYNFRTRISPYGGNKSLTIPFNTKSGDLILPWEKTIPKKSPQKNDKRARDSSIPGRSGPAGNAP